MIVGVLSDSHGRQRRTARALRMLRRLGAEAFIHCGDLQGDGVLEELAAVGARFVWGNVDYVDATVEAHARSLGLNPPAEVPLRLELAGKRIAVYHGHEPAFERLVAALANGDAVVTERLAGDYVLHGHTHVPNDHRVGSLRIVNPGALHRAMVHTCATLDLERDEVRFLRVEDGDADTDARPYHPPIAAP